jgi:signal transduction histidine kinase
MSDPARSARRAWQTLGLRLAFWYLGVTLVSYLALAAILPFTVHAWAETESRRATAGALDRYRLALEEGGTDALRAMFACRGGPGPSVALRLSDEQNIEILRVASDDVSHQVASDLSQAGMARLAVGRPPEGWDVAATSVSQGRELEIVLHDDAGDRIWRNARRTSLLLLSCGMLLAIVGVFLITQKALRPIGELARATQGVIDSGDLALRVRTRGTGDALDDLAALFNQMLTRQESLVRAMKESLDNVAHDLRTPLARLRAGAELALREADGTPRSQEALAEAIEESDRVLAMMTTLMDITGAETGAMRLDRHVEDLAAIVREAVDLYDIVSSERGVHIVTRLSPGVLVLVDRARMRQACANLIDNAVKYTGSGGRVEVTVLRDDDTALIRVLDTGRGIAPEDRSRVWERLYRGDHSRSERGLGLGLSLVKAVIEAHGGRVAVESEVGAGSTFEVRLPIAPA